MTAKLSDEGNAGFEDFYAAICQLLLEETILAVAETTDRLAIRRIGRIAMGQADLARYEEAAHSLVSGHAIDEASVVLFSERAIWLAAPVCTLGKEFVEQLLPCRCMQLRRIGDHAVKVKEEGRVTLFMRIGRTRAHRFAVSPFCGGPPMTGISALPNFE
ncbi:hypothetical protein GCM10011371_28350 [Novosphingobium marinum]|nr:hypothetical protein GCM10011371_28350 [Novosphingobium marinum]